MTYTIKRSDLNQKDYGYIWTRDSGDGPQTGSQDRAKVDKDEGYEVLTFIQSVYDAKGYKTDDMVSTIEDILQSPEYSQVQLRKDLKANIMIELGN